MSSKRTAAATLARTVFTQDAKAAFLAIFRERCSIREAAEAVGVTRTTIYNHIKSDEAFAGALEAARSDAADRLEEVAYARAVEGTDVPVFRNGEVVGHVTRKSDRLLAMLLRAHRPEKYGNGVQPKIGAGFMGLTLTGPE